MFTNSLDNKQIFINADGEALVDLTASMYVRMYNMDFVHSIYRANKQCEMRPDYLSACLYGDEAYAEITIKSAMISNPFALEEGDLVFAMTLDNVYNGVREASPDEKAALRGVSVYELVKRYHKYIDKAKVPDVAGSEENKVEALSEKSKPAIEPNISKTGATGVVVKNGKIYFGKNKSEADKIQDKLPIEISDGMHAIDTGSFEPYEYNDTTEEDDYFLEGLLTVDDEDESLEFDIEDDVEEDFGKYAAENADQKANNILLDGTKIFFTGDEGEDDGTEIESGLIVPANSDEVDCAKSGISLGKFLSASVSSCKS